MKERRDGDHLVDQASQRASCRCRCEISAKAHRQIIKHYNPKEVRETHNTKETQTGGGRERKSFCCEFCRRVQAAALSVGAGDVAMGGTFLGE